MLRLAHFWRVFVIAALVAGMLVAACTRPEASGALRVLAPAPGSTVADGALSISVGGAELPAGAQWQYRLDGVAVATTPRAQVKLTGVESGEHTVVVTAVNGQGQPTSPRLEASSSFRFALLAAFSTLDPESIDIRVYPTAAATASPEPGRPTASSVRATPAQPTNTPTLGGATARPMPTRAPPPTLIVPSATPAPTATTRPTPTPRPGRIVTLTYVGVDADEVGYYSPEPDQKQDSHFRVTLTLETPRAVTNMTLYAADREGNRTGVPVWDITSPQYWALGVRRNGLRLNPTRAAFNDAVSGEVAYDVYGSINGPFEDNQVFAVSLTLSDGSEVYGITSIPPAPTPTPRPGSIVKLTWEGFGGADKVGAFRPEPDGMVDAKLAATFELSSPKTVKQILLYSSDQYGREQGSQYWVTVGKGERWVLAVFRDGVHLNSADEPLSDLVNGRITYELWAGQTGFFRREKGLFLSVTITFTDGSSVHGTVALPERV